MVDEAALREWRDNDCRHTRAGAPAVGDRRGNVVPAATVLIVGEDDERVCPVRAVADCVHQVGGVLLPAGKIGVARVLVVGAQRLDEGDGWKSIVCQVIEELRLVL